MNDVSPPNQGAAIPHGSEGYVLHTYPYKETSLLVEVFTRSSGRVTLVARSARRPRSAMRGTLMAFQPLFISWSGKGEVKTLTKAEWLGGIPLLGGEALLCAFYLNELLMKLLPREDAHEILFDKYAETIRHFSNGGSFSPVLRRFEKFFLKELGYELVLDHDASTGQKIDPLKDYTYDPERGPMEARHSGLEPIISGRTLLSLAQDELEGNKILAEARALMRLLINHRLDSRPLNSRKVFLELLEL